MTSPSGGQTYWGALPPPAVVAQRQNSVRRNSYNANRKAQLPPDADLRGIHDSPYPSEAQPAGRQNQNRMSQQSNTTQSSQNTWIDDSVDQRGLNPRRQQPPLGLQGPYNPEAEERRRRRASKQAAEERAEWERSSGNGYVPQRQSSHRQSQSQGAPEHFYRNNGYKPQRGPLSVNTDLGRSNTTGRISPPRQAADDAERGIRRGSITARKEKPEIRSAVDNTRQRRPSGRRVSEVSQEGFTADKSPLQALETNFAKLKEEKRAKALEAERQVRERQASGASTATRGTQNTVHFDGSSEAAPKLLPQRAVVEDIAHDISPKTSAQIQDTTPRKQSSLSQALEERSSSKRLQKKKLNKTEQVWADLAAQAHGGPAAPGDIKVQPVRKERMDKKQQAWADLAAQAHGAGPQQKVPTINEPGVQRNASFRERAGPARAPEIILGTTASVGRRDSNKLKKNSPTDPWRLAREDMEMQAEEIARVRRSEREAQQQQIQVSGGPLGSSPIDPPAPVSAMMSGGSEKTHANTKKQREALYVAAQPINHDIDDDIGMQPVKRSNSQLKVEHLLGADIAFQKPNSDIRRAISPAEQQLYADRLDRSVELGPDGQGDIYGMSQQNMGGKNVQMSALTGEGALDHDDDHLNARDADGRHHFSNIFRGGRGNYRPGAGLYLPDKRLEEWKSAGIASLTGALLHLDMNAQAASAAQLEADKDKAWWEAGRKGKRDPSTGGTFRPMEAFGGDMSSEGNNAPTKFSPPLYLKCGPLLRYTGIRREAVATRPGQPKRRDREIWRGSVMIVTTDTASDYRTPPTLRLFAQPKSLLPPPPETLGSGEELPHEYIDPIAGHPKCGRNGQTLYVRPVEFLPEEIDLSKDESDKGLFSRTRDPSSANAGRQPTIDGEKTGKSVSVKGFRLHAERGATFWRFNMEVELTKTQQRIAYRINGGPPTGFWVPALGEGMNIMNYSCNGFSMSVNADSFSGPDPLWRDVLNTHQTRPFHVMIGGGDQVYNDCVMRETSVFAEWLAVKNPLYKHNAPFTTAMQDELEEFYLERYAMWFSQGLFGLANSQIPMVNVWDDHDIIDGFGSYPHHFMDSPVFTGLGAIAFKYYMLFQHQSSVDEGPANEPSWLLGTKPGPYIKERSRSLFISLGGGLSFLGLDCRTERTRDEILSEQTYDAILDRCYAELVKGTTTHLIVLLGVPIAYPRLVWLENILTSRIMDPIKALSRAGAFGNLLNNFDGGVEILDDLDDHWTAKNHKAERRFLIQDLQDLAASKSVRITILSGDVHLAAIGQFFSSKNEDGTPGPIPKDKDHRYMPNVISSAIVNTPPPDMLADVLARRDKIHHLDGETDENMIPLFGTDVDGKKRNNKVMLPRRNWASIRVYDGSASPPGTPGAGGTPSPEKGGGLGGLVRRLSMNRNESFGPGPNRRQDSFGPRPPISGGGGGLLRRLSTSHGRPAAGTFDGAGEAAPTKRSSSTGGIGGLIRRLSQSGNRPPKRRDRGGVNGYESETEEEYPYRDAPDIVRTRHGTFLRGGAAEFSEDDTEYQGMGLRGGGTVSRSEEAIERNQEYFASKKGYRRGEEDPNDSDATPPPIRTGARGTSAGAAALPRSNTYSDSRHTSVAPVSRDGSNLQRSNTTNTLRKSMHRTPTGLSTKGGLFSKKAAPEPINLEGGLEITLNVEVNKKDPAGITAPYRLLVPRLWYEEPVRPMGADGAMENLPAPPLKRGNSFSGGLGGLMRRLSTTTKATLVQTPQIEQGDPIKDQPPNIRVGEGGLQRKPTVGDRMKGVFGLGRRRSMESYSGSEAESYDEHADTRLVPRANYGKKATGKQAAPATLAAPGSSAPSVPLMNRGPPVVEDEDAEIRPAHVPEVSAKPAAYSDEPQRVVYRDQNTEAALERKASLDRPQGGIQRRNTLGDKLKGAMGLGRRDSIGSYTGSENSYEDSVLPAPKKQVSANARDTRGPYPSLQQQQAAGRTSLDRPQGGMQRNISLSAKLKGAMGLGRRDSVENWSGSDVDDADLPVNQFRAAPAAATYDRVPQQQAEQNSQRQSLDRPRAGHQKKTSRGGGLMKAMGLGRRDDYSEGSYTGSEDESELAPQPRNNAAGQRISLAPLNRQDPSLSQRQQAPPEASLDRPQGHQRRASLGGGLKAALGLGGGRRDRDDYSSHTESDDEYIARRQATERAAATGDRRYPSLPQDRPPSNANADREANAGSAAGRANLDRRDSARRVDSGPLPPQRKPTVTGRLGNMIGLGRRSPAGSFSGSEHSESEREEILQTMPRGDERSVETDEEGGPGGRGFKKISGTKVERGQPLRKEGESGFTRQERMRRRREDMKGSMENPGSRR